MKQTADFPKRQHFVPEMIQKRFLGSDGLLWYFDRRRGVIDRTVPGNLFVEGHLYTMENNQGDRSGAIEKLLSKVEDATDPVLSQIIARARLGKSPALSDEQRWTVLLYLYLQHRRVPDFIRNVPFDEPMGQKLAKIVTELEAERGQIDPKVRARYLGPETAKRVEQNFRALGVLGDIYHSPSFRAFNARGISVAVVNRPNVSFVLGSFPIFRSSADGRTDLSHPDVELWMPIAPDVAVGLAGPAEISNLRSAGTGQMIAKMNKNIRDKSTVIASPSRYLIDVLSRKMRGPIP